MSERRQLQCPGTRVTCPACGRPIPLLDVRNGDGFALCPHKVGAFETRRRCGQHVYWTCTRRLCTVVALTQDERRRFDGGHYTSAEILAELGVAACGEAA